MPPLLYYFLNKNFFVRHSFVHFPPSYTCKTCGKTFERGDRQIPTQVDGTQEDQLHPLLHHLQNKVQLPGAQKVLTPAGNWTCRYQGLVMGEFMLLLNGIGGGDEDTCPASTLPRGLTAVYCILYAVFRVYNVYKC